jgi:hypothetical protein
MAIRAGPAQFRSGGMRIAVRRVHRFRRVTDQTNTRWLLVWHPEGSGHRRCRLAASSRNRNRWGGRTRPGRRHDHCPPTSRPKCQTTTTTESQSTPMSNSLHDPTSPTKQARRKPSQSAHACISDTAAARRPLSASVADEIAADSTCNQPLQNYSAGLKNPDLLPYLACRLRAGRTPTVQKPPANNAGNISGRQAQSIDCGSVML